MLEKEFNNNKQLFVLSLLNSKKYKDTKKSIIENTQFLDSFASLKQRIWHLLNNDKTLHLCECNAQLKFKDLGSGYHQFCSRECKCKSSKTKEKFKNTCLLRFGTKTPAESKAVKDKTKQSNLIKYGVESHNQALEIKEKKRVVILEKYGVENVSQIKEVREKRKQTFLDRFGVENPNQAESIKEKKRKYFMNKFGGICPAKNAEVQNKLRIINSSKEVQDKTKKTVLAKYGVEHVAQNGEIKEKTRKKTLHVFYNKLLKGNRLQNILKPLFEFEEYKGSIKQSYKFQCLKCNNIFKDNISYNRVPRCLSCFPITNGHSLMEKDLIVWLQSLNIEIQESDRKLIRPLELDIYLPEFKLAIEFNGLFWHSELNDKDSNYHLNKTDMCLEKEIQLIHIFEDEWLNKQDIIKSIILAKIGKTKNVIYARNCDVREVDAKESALFLENNHLQGQNRQVSYSLGLCYNNELVQLIGIGKSRFNNNYDYELIRSCCKIDTVVVGGFERLLNNVNLKGSIISYVDRRFFSGNSYISWNFNGKTSPAYFYMKGYLNRESRFKYQKHKLEYLFPDIYDKDLTEWQIMQLNGYDRIWDCGNLVFSKVL